VVKSIGVGVLFFILVLIQPPCISPSQSFPLTCHYWMRPKPVASPPAGFDRLTPLLHFRFSQADFTSHASGPTTIRNHGSLGATGDGNISATCTGTDTGFVSAGRQGGGFVFDGETCHVRVSDPVAPLAGNHWTIMFWVKRKSVVAGQLLVFRGDDGPNWNAGETQIKFSIDPPPSGEIADELVRVFCGLVWSGLVWSGLVGLCFFFLFCFVFVFFVMFGFDLFIFLNTHLPLTSTKSFLFYFVFGMVWSGLVGLCFFIVLFCFCFFLFFVSRFFCFFGMRICRSPPQNFCLNILYIFPFYRTSAQIPVAPCRA
jgi:hypothetical protein